MAAAAKNAYLVNEIAFFQNCTFTMCGLSADRQANILYPARKLFYMKKTLIFLCTVVLIASCNNSKKEKTIENGLPSCIQKDLDAIKKGEMKNPPVQIDEYNYNGKRVFLYTADCCDQFNTAYDENCGTVCAPTGGMEGGGDHQCEDFSTKARFVTNIWSKSK